MNEGRRYRLTSFRVPYPRCTVVADGSEARSVRTEPGGQHDAFVPERRKQQPAIGCIPNACRAVARAGDDALSIQAEVYMFYNGRMCQHGSTGFPISRAHEPNNVFVDNGDGSARGLESDGGIIRAARPLAAVSQRWSQRGA